jgi:hypothetical protein
LRPKQLPWHRRLRQALRLLAVFFAAPLLLGALLGPPGAGLAAMIGAVLVLTSSMANGRRATRYAAPLMIAAMVAGSLTKTSWLWVLLVAALAGLSGLATMRGAGLAVSMSTLQAVAAPPFHDWDRVLVLIGFTVLGAGYGWVMGGRVGAPPTTPAPFTGRRYAVSLAIALFLAAGLAAAFAHLTQWEHITWMVAAVVVLGIPTPGLTQRLMGQRMLGQLGACGVVVVIALISTDPWFLLAAAVVCLTLYLMALGRPMWEQVTYLSAFFMLPAAAATSGAVLVGERLLYNLIGLGLLMLVLLGLRWARRFVGDESVAAAT